ncbi:major facilitator superfamily domain-containing protein [Lipomyces oligophaga]|uniref:major facilitator superfamily domain-containing protein n=1 Tax=Lipomyces oligophaga TaxID=45792 RepID=UPI0034CF5191
MSSYNSFDQLPPSSVDTDEKRQVVEDSESIDPAASLYDSDVESAYSHEVGLSAEDRPAVFKSNFHEYFTIIILTFSTIMNTASLGVIQVAVPALGRYFQIEGGQLSWSLSSFQLMSGATILLFSGVADKIGRKRVVLLSYATFALWCLICAFTTHHIFFDVCRGMQGLAAAACPSAGVGILGSNYKNGRRKNKAMAIFNAGAPIGLYFGIICGGVSVQYLNWRATFYLYAIIYFVLAFLVYFVVPGDGINDNVPLSFKYVCSRIGSLDLFGAFLSIAGLFMIVLGVSQASSASNGWATPYVIVLLILSILTLISFVYWESRVSNPIMPLHIWRAPSFAILMVIILFFWMCFTGVLQFYGGLYVQNVMGVSPIKAVLYFLPQPLSSVFAITLIASTMHLIPGRLVLMFAEALMLAASLLWALNPMGTTFFAMIFPALCLEIIAADLSYNVVNMHTLTSVSSKEQSIAAGIFYTFTHVAGSLGVAISSSIVSSISRREMMSTVKLATIYLLDKAYKGAFYFAAACAGVAFVLSCFADIKAQGADVPEPVDEEEQAQTVDPEVACVLAPGETTCGRRASEWTNSFFEDLDSDPVADELSGLLESSSSGSGKVYNAVA